MSVNTQTLSISQQLPAVETSQEDRALTATTEVVKNNLQDHAQNILNCGECLSYAKYAKWVPGAPEFLKHRAWVLAGDACKVVNSGIKIKTRVDNILNKDQPLDEKLKQLIEVAQLASKMVNTQFVEYLPASVNETIKHMNSAMGIASLGLKYKAKQEEVEAQEPGLAQTKDKIEATQLALSTADAALDLAGVNTFPFKATLFVGGGLLSAAKAGVSAASFVAGLLPGSQKPQSKG